MKAVITLDNLELAKVELEENGIQRTLHLTLQQLAELLLSSLVEDYNEPKEEPAKPILISPSLPLNTVKYAKKSDESHLVFLSYPETTATVQYHQSVFQDVPFPNLVFFFAVKNQRVSNRQVFAYKDRFLRDDTKLYRYPYSNVYENGRMCYYSDETVKDLVQLQTFPHRWLHTPFNDHLYFPRQVNLTSKPLRQLLEESQGKPFDYSILRPAPQNLTFHEWAESIIN